jgi:hypothetical protein
LGRINIKGSDPLDIMLLVANNFEKVDFVPQARMKNNEKQNKIFNQYDVRIIINL